ncbi:MAG: AbrB/MazE/SpoVT family DNA-binding domain-containing protein [Desulfobacterales bacterium]|jgi:hypothetical protein
MADNTQIETTRLWEMAKAGKSAEEMMESLGIRDRASLKQALQNAMREKGESVVVPGLIGRAGLRTRYTDQGIRIPPAMLEGSAFRSGDEFDLDVEDDHIVLKKSAQ